MKRAHTSGLLFLGVWLAVLLAGYMASRADVFAAGGANNCIPCTNCVNMDTWWASGAATDGGSVWTADGHTPAAIAWNGTNQGGTTDIFTNYGCDGTSAQTECENYVTLVSYASATFECNITKSPPPTGTYKCDNGQILTPTKVSICWSVCTNP